MDTASGAIISGWGMCVPATIVSNGEIMETLRQNVTDEKLRGKLHPDWPLKTIGIESRRRANLEQGENAAFLTGSAAAEALRSRGITLMEIDCVISITSGTADNDAIPHLAGATHEWLKRRYDLPTHTAPIFDLNAGCSGGLYGMAVACAMLCTGLCKRVLLTMTDMLFSKRGNPADPDTYQVFGDGSSAFILELSVEKGYGIMENAIMLDGSGDTKTLRSENGFAKMDTGKDVYRFATRKGAADIPAVLKRLGLSVNDVQHFLFHQANDAINITIAKLLAVDPERCYSNIRHYGNTGCASIGILFCEVVEKFKRGDTILFYAAGAGLSWAVVVMRWSLRQYHV